MLLKKGVRSKHLGLKNGKFKSQISVDRSYHNIVNFNFPK